MTDQITPVSDPVQDVQAKTQIAADLTKWRMKDYSKWIKTAKSGDIEAINVILASVVTAWPYSGDPGNADNYGELTPAEWKVVGEAVSDTATALFQ